MGQEFIINSTALEDKINQLLPSQGGKQAGVDLSASTQIIPIVDLTESAEGSNFRQDLQTALSLTSCTAFSVTNTTTTIINTTGYFRIFGAASGSRAGAGADFVVFSVTDGTTTKILVSYDFYDPNALVPFNFNVFLRAGESVTLQTTSINQVCKGVTRQIADISGNLVNP